MTNSALLKQLSNYKAGAFRHVGLALFWQALLFDLEEDHCAADKMINVLLAEDLPLYQINSSFEHVAVSHFCVYQLRQRIYENKQEPLEQLQQNQTPRWHDFTVNIEFAHYSESYPCTDVILDETELIGLLEVKLSDVKDACIRAGWNRFCWPGTDRSGMRLERYLLRGGVWELTRGEKRFAEFSNKNVLGPTDIARAKSIAEYLRDKGVPESEWQRLRGFSVKGIYDDVKHQESFLRQGSEDQPITFDTFQTVWKKYSQFKIVERGSKSQI